MCPFLDRPDARCATHLTLANLPRAFRHCADQYTLCPIYQKLVGELISDAWEYEESDAPAGVLVAS